MGYITGYFSSNPAQGYVDHVSSGSIERFNCYFWATIRAPIIHAPTAPLPFIGKC